MYCPKCGAQNEDNAYRCTQCDAVMQGGGAPGGAEGPPAEKPANYLVPAILVTLFCCLPFGIVAIIFAAQVNGKLEAGDYVGAQSASKNAKLFTWLSFGIGAVVLGAYILLMVLAAVAGG